MTEIPLFPLRTVLYPDGILPLRIFEQRYLTMVRECASNGAGFGVCLILEGEETGTDAKPAGIGTLAQIIDWYTLEDGLLGVSAAGTARFMLQQTRRRPDGLLLGTVSLLPEPSPSPVPEAFSVLSQVLGGLMERLGDRYPSFTAERLDDAVWVGYRLAELLPMAAAEKQHLLELSDPFDRLQSLLEILPRFQHD